MRIQLGAPDNTFLDPTTYNQLFTMHGTTMIFWSSSRSPPASGTTSCR